MKRSFGIAAALVAASLAVGTGATTIASGRSATPAQESPSAAATGCTVGVSWNNFQQPRWAAHDQPNIKATVEAGGGTYIDKDANLSTEQQLTDIDTLIAQGATVLASQPVTNAISAVAKP